ncbi:hypothetical protein AYO44_05195 [Planctomycetaceae bacterium SCGC AG-212-F19]|nr:hypothetical protein AYO44_05195 [Planctomycetaceae bacterium SCGC AG-212-F19]
MYGAGKKSRGREQVFGKGALRVQIETPVSNANGRPEPADDQRHQDAQDRVGAHNKNVGKPMVLAQGDQAPRGDHPRGIENSPQSGSLAKGGAPDAADRDSSPVLAQGMGQRLIAARAVAWQCLNAPAAPSQFLSQIVVMPGTGNIIRMKKVVKECNPQARPGA